MRADLAHVGESCDHGRYAVSDRAIAQRALAIGCVRCCEYGRAHVG